MKQLSPFFVVVGETPDFSVCETISKNGQHIWRFLIRWDEDHDLRIVDVVNHFISTGEMEGKDITTIGESSGKLHIHSYVGAEHFAPNYCVDGDQWFVVVDNDEVDIVGKAHGAGARAFVDVVEGVYHERG
jgi:phage tail sheath protein FI